MNPSPWRLALLAALAARLAFAAPASAGGIAAMPEAPARMSFQPAGAWSASASVLAGTPQMRSLLAGFPGGASLTPQKFLQSRVVAAALFDVTRQGTLPAPRPEVLASNGAVQARLAAEFAEALARNAAVVDQRVAALEERLASPDAPVAEIPALVAELDALTGTDGFRYDAKRLAAIDARARSSERVFAAAKARGALDLAQGEARKLLEERDPGALEAGTVAAPDGTRGPAVRLKKFEAREKTAAPAAVDSLATEAVAADASLRGARRALIFGFGGAALALAAVAGGLALAGVGPAVATAAGVLAVAVAAAGVVGVVRFQARFGAALTAFSRAEPDLAAAVEKPATPIAGSRIPRTLEDFVRVFATQESIDANINSDIIAALALEWNVKDLEVVKRRIRNALAVYNSLVEIREANRAFLRDFERRNPGRGPGTILNRLARRTHMAWFLDAVKPPVAKTASPELSELLAGAARDGRLAASGETGGVAIAFPTDAEREAFAAKFKALSGRDLDESVVNLTPGAPATVSGLRLVAYDQPLHDLLLDAVRRGEISMTDASGKTVTMTPEIFEDFKDKHKIKPAQFRFADGARRRAFAAAFRAATGANFDAAWVNTVAGDWDKLQALKARTNPAAWAEGRADKLFELQFDSVAAILGSLSDPAFLRRLGSRDAKVRMRAALELLRRINVGWRVNNPYGGFDDKLIHLPFDTAENGGIGVPDIQKDGVVAEAVLAELLESSDFQVDRAMEVALRRAAKSGRVETMHSLTDADALTAALAEYRPKSLGVGQIPRSLEEFVRLFGNRQSIDDNINYDIILALAKEWHIDDLEEVKRRMHNALQVHDNLSDLRAVHRQIMRAFETANRGAGKGAILDKLARATHDAWYKKVAQSQGFVAYSQGLHDLFLEQVRARRVFVKDTAGRKVLLSAEEFENPDAKFKFRAEDLAFGADDAARRSFEERFKTLTRSDWSSSVVNTVAAPWDALTAVVARARAADWAKGRSSYLYGLQADSVGAVLSALNEPEILEKLASRDPAVVDAAVVRILRRINAGWRLNNPFGGFTDRLIHKPFDLEENGGIGIQDILLDAEVLRAVLSHLNDAIMDERVTIDQGIARGIRHAFDSGLGATLARSVDRASLEDMIRANRVEEDFTARAEKRKLAVQNRALRLIPLEDELAQSGLDDAQLARMRAKARGVQDMKGYLDGLKADPDRGGISLGSYDPRGLYESASAVGGLQTWRWAYRRQYDEATRPITEDFLRRVTDDPDIKRIVFFVPSRAATPENRGVTSEELRWLLDPSHPERMAKVVFVFGAYDLVSDGDFKRGGFGELEPTALVATLTGMLKDYASHLAPVEASRPVRRARRSFWRRASAAVRALEGKGN